MIPHAFTALCLTLASVSPAPAEPPTFIDATDAVGLGGISAARLCLADLDGDGRPDAIIRERRPGERDRYRVFLNRADPAAPHGFRFVELDRPTGLPTPRDGDNLVFADFDNDGRADAIFTRYLDVNSDKFTEPEDEPKRTAWLKGAGDGTFGPPRVIEAAQRATTAAVAVGDVNRDGRLDLFLGNWYTNYGASNEGFRNDLLVQDDLREGLVFRRVKLLDELGEFTEEHDRGGRPTYGVLVFTFDPAEDPDILELNYGRRANRLWRPVYLDIHWADEPTPEEARNAAWAFIDYAPQINLHGDPIRHGRYPEWLKEVAKRDPRFDRADEKPYRSHGNTFDAAVGDIDNDGDFDLFFAEITHGWAGDSSDRSRFLLNESNNLRFTSPARLSVDRIPPIPPREEWPEGWFPRWNQGDLFCELADLDHDGRLDLILSSGDYPDPPPFDQRLRIFHQQPDGTFRDATAESGIDHVGSQQISLGDLDGDGDLDILVGQTFNRFTPAMVEARTPPGPVARVFLNQTADKRRAADPAAGPGAITLKLVGDPGRSVNRDALGAVVEVLTRSGDAETRHLRQLIGVGGHAGKQHEFIIHVGLGAAAKADEVRIRWPNAEAAPTILRDLPPGRHVITVGRPKD